MDYGQLSQKIDEDISSLKEEVNVLKKEMNERFISKEDFIRMFTEFSKLRKEQVTELNSIKSTVSRLSKKVEDELRAFKNESMKREERLLKLAEQERSTRSEIRKVELLKDDVDDIQKGIEKIRMNSSTVADFESFTAKNRAEIERLKEKVEFLFSNSVDVEDIENNFITSKQQDKKLAKIDETKLDKNEAEYEITIIQQKISDLSQKADDIDSDVGMIRSELSSKAGKEDSDNLRKEFAKKDSFNAEVARIDQDLKEMDGIIDGMEAALEKSASQKEITSSSFERLRQDIEKIKSNMILKSEVEKVLNSSTTRYNGLKKDVDRSIEVLSSKISSLKEEMEELEKSFTKNIKQSTLQKRTR